MKRRQDPLDVVLVGAISLALLALFPLFAAAKPARGTADDVNSQRSTFKAAVYAHAVIVPPRSSEPVSREQAVENMDANLDVYREQAAEAGKQGAEIIVFPEDGIYGFSFDRDTIYPYLEFMPDPNQEVWIPCDDPYRYNNSDVQVALSCMAKDNQLYLVANFGDKQPCDPDLDPNCPSDRRYQYNTDAAYGPDGTFLAKYHKYNLFFEDQFDTPPPTAVYFDTPFGRFGMMTCFDILFREPGITLVEKYNITDMAFPTAWMDALPLLPAIGFHSSFARAHGINLLGANIHLPDDRFTGTGLYAPEGAHAFYYGSVISGSNYEPKLIVADMNVIAKSAGHAAVSGPAQEYPSTEEGLLNLASSLHGNVDPGLEFVSTLNSDQYTFRTLDDVSGNITVCQKHICCHLEYAISDKDEDEVFAFAAFDGLHTDDGYYYMQNCALVKCADPDDLSLCGDYVFDSATTFSKIKISVHGLQTPYVYPQVVLSNPDGELAIAGPGVWTLQGSTLETADSFNEIVLNAILLGRDYSKDDDHPGVNDVSRKLDEVIDDVEKIGIN